MFRAKLEKLFLVPSRTFDNVKGNFPIGFFIWNTDKKVGRHSEQLSRHSERSEAISSAEAKSVYDSGLELWRYYHTKPLANPDASFYDIRKYFQGETNGRMNSDSNDEHYTELIADLRAKMKALAAKIEPKVYEFGFLK